MNYEAPSESLSYCRVCGAKEVRVGFLCGFCIGQVNDGMGTNKVSEGYRETVRCILGLQTGMRVTFPGENHEEALKKALNYKSLQKWVDKYGKETVYPLIVDFITDDTRSVRRIAKDYGFCRDSLYYFVQQINLPARRLTLSGMRQDGGEEVGVMKRKKVSQWFRRHPEFIDSNDREVTRADLLGRIKNETGLIDLSAATLYRGLEEARVSI